jgi:short-subunit dehydrogenase
MPQTPPTILISGASRGIGKAIAATLTARGATVLGTSRHPETPDLLPLDVTDDASVAACVAGATARLGHLDVLIANAGYDLYGALADTSLTEFADQMETNLMGTVRIVKAALPHMLARGKGRIIIIGSIGGQIGLPMNSAYAASKFAVHGFAEALRLELLPSGIPVSLIIPPAVSTETLATSIRQTARTSPRTDAMVAAMRSSGAASKITPRHVAETVAKAVFAPKPRLSYPVGTQAKWLPRMRALMPQAMFESILRKQFP